MNAKIGRNDPCPCGSGRKYKQCHGSAAGPADGGPGAAELSNLGNLLHDQGKLEAAEASFRKALAQQPDAAEIHSNLGVTLHALRRFEDAARSHRRALELKPDYAAAHFNLALALQARGEPEQAIASFRRAAELSPGLVEAHDRLALAQGALVPLWHVPMMNDRERNDAYDAALRAAVTPESRVLEIGTGSGLLAMMAARAGAKSVTTCEAEPAIAAAAERVIAANGFAGRIRVLAQLSTKVELEEKADLLVSEIFSSELLAEGVLPSIADAKRRLLKPGARVIPAAGGIVLALFGGEGAAANLHAADSAGFDLREFNRLAPRRQLIHRRDLGIELLSDPVEALRFEFEREAPPPPAARRLRVPVTRDGRCYGLVQWLRLQLDARTTFENHPLRQTAASGWQLCAYLLPEPLDVRAGQTATVSAIHNGAVSWFSIERIDG